MKEPQLLKLENLKTYYPIKKGLFSRTVGHLKAVDGISLQISAGETLGLVGESGCGKSTLGRSIVRLEQPTAGKILFAGRDITNSSQSMLRTVRKELQIVFQDPYASLNPRKKIGDSIGEPILAMKLVDHGGLHREISRLMELVGLPHSFIERYPFELSGGQRQRVGIARALAVGPKMLVCDEPVSALDVSIQAQILNLFAELQKELGLTYLFISHGIGAIRHISKRVAVMYLGKIVEIADKEAIFQAPRHPYTQILLRAYPVADPRLRSKKREVITGDIPSATDIPAGCRFHTRCPFAQAICREQEPVLDEGSHAVSCHFPLH